MTTNARANNAKDNASTMARVTGSVAATVTHERRLASGELVTEASATMPGTNVTAPAPAIGECDGCGNPHPASYSHESVHGQGPVWEVPCPIDGRSTFVTVEGLVSR